MSGTTGLAETRLRHVLGLETEPVAVFLLRNDSAEPALETFERVTAHRYCQVLMRARHGESLLLEPDGLTCPAAAAAFGFKPLPSGLASGKALVGFGIVSDASAGKAMFDAMPRLPMGSVEAIAACPLAEATALPDVVVIEAPPEQLMWLLLADLNLAGGRRRQGDTAVLQATCVDATIIPHVEQRLNFSLGCYGCREATDLANTDAVLGFPGASLEPLTESLHYLHQKAVGRSRAKAALENLKRKERQT